MSKKCPVCNRDLPEEAAFCMSCFTILTPVKEASQTIKEDNKKIFLHRVIPVISVLLLFAVGIAFYVNSRDKADDIAVSDTKTLTVNSPATEAPTALTGTSSSAAPDSTSETASSQTSLPQDSTSVSDTTSESATQEPSSVTIQTEKQTQKEDAVKPSAAVTVSEKPTSKAAKSTSTTEASRQEKPSVSVSRTEKSTQQTAPAQTGELKYSGYGNGVIITSYSGNESAITIPDRLDGKPVLAIGERAFGSNKNIKSITLEEGGSVKYVTIKAGAFYNLESLTTLNLPSCIEADNFTQCVSGCPRLERVNISTKFSNNEYYSSNGIVYRKYNNGTALVLYPTGRCSSSFTIPYKVTEINKNAFAGNPNLTKLRFSKRETLSVSWSNMFSDSNLKSLKIIEVYVGTDADIKGIQYFDGEILYYD